MIPIETLNEQIQVKNIRETLLELSDIEKEERKNILRDYLFYEGRAKTVYGINYEDLNDPDLLGQSWKSSDNLDYSPTKEIRNKVKYLLKKQAGFIFGNAPSLTYRPDVIENKEKCEELRKYVDDILDDNNFWMNTQKAFLEATIKKRVVLRVEIIPKRPIRIKYENIENCSYKEKNGHIMEIRFFEEDEGNAYKDKDTEKLYYLHTYYYDLSEDEEGYLIKKVMYRKDTYRNSKKIDSEEFDTGFNVIPCWVIKNGGLLNSTFGESDLADLIDAQLDYNKTVSDMRDALRFSMFGAMTVIDGDPADVNRLRIAPGNIHAISSMDNMGDSKQAKIDKLEYNMSAAEAVEKHLKRCIDDMFFTLSMPQLSDLVNIPSAKSMIFLYNDLIARCQQKLGDWINCFDEMLRFVINQAQYCYRDFNKELLKINYTIEINLNYPLPSTLEDAKTLAIQEVKERVRSHRSYIEEFSLEEDYKTEWNNVVKEVKELTEAESDSYETSINNELDSDTEDDE